MNGLLDVGLGGAGARAQRWSRESSMPRTFAPVFCFTTSARTRGQAAELRVAEAVGRAWSVAYSETKLPSVSWMPSETATMQLPLFCS